MPLADLLQKCIDKGASALHIKVGVPAIIRVHGDLVPLLGQKLGANDTRTLCYEALSDEQRTALEDEGEVEGDFTTASGDRFTWCVFRSKNEVAGVFHNAAVAREKPTRTAEEEWGRLAHFEQRPREDHWNLEDFRGEDGAPIPASIGPTIPPRTGHDAKPPPGNGIGDDNMAAQ